MPAGSYQTFSSTRTLHRGRVLLTHDPLIHFVLISQRIPFILKIFWSVAADKQLRYPGARCDQESLPLVMENQELMTRWGPRGVRTNVYWWRSVLYRGVGGDLIIRGHRLHHLTSGLHPLRWCEKKPGWWVPGAACKFMLIEPQEMWEHFLLTFNKHKQISTILCLPLKWYNIVGINLD